MRGKQSSHSATWPHRGNTCHKKLFCSLLSHKASATRLAFAEENMLEVIFFLPLTFDSFHHLPLPEIVENLSSNWTGRVAHSSWFVPKPFPLFLSWGNAAHFPQKFSVVEHTAHCYVVPEKAADAYSNCAATVCSWNEHRSYLFILKSYTWHLLCGEI